MRTRVIHSLSLIITTIWVVVIIIIMVVSVVIMYLVIVECVSSIEPYAKRPTNPYRNDWQRDLDCIVLYQ